MSNQNIKNKKEEKMNERNDWIVKIPHLLKPAAIIAIIGVVGLAILGMVPRPPYSHASQIAPKPSFEISVLVPDRVILIKAHQQMLSTRIVDTTDNLSLGIKEISKKYDIKNIAAINQYIDNGSVTGSLLVIVEPK
ncbi:MAG: hypothetical protein PHC97_02345 [Patescibacteria group bacterium]|nr:hypothetical protein [Patescibacteria group bacterium]